MMLELNWFAIGTVFRKPGENYLVDSFKIGKCNQQDELKNCSGGCNDYEAGDYCGNENIRDVANGNPGARCEKNYGPKITIECVGIRENDSTCHGGNCERRIIHYSGASWKWVEYISMF